ncbi:MAG: 2-iminoacetate synthase ThiH [Bacteroidota bacterium]
MFKQIFQEYNWKDALDNIYSKEAQDVVNALRKEKPDLNDFAAFISPAAEPFLEQMAQKSKVLTEERFGKTISLFAPLYLSNECQNICTYCGFSLNNDLRRKTLTDSEIEQECKAVKSMGFEHILLVTGEANKRVGMPYFLNALSIVKSYFSNVSMEVQPLEVEDYISLQRAGVHSILVYQETYDEKAYANYHPKGKKSNFEYRLATPDRIGKSGMHKIGIGALLGLSDWRTDSFFSAMHLNYLEKTFWQSRYAISFPRLRPFSGGKVDSKVMSDRDLVQLICAFRLFNQELDISLSTRESEHFRNHVIHVGVTTMSAGSKTNPGGYSVETKSLEQFEIDDQRSPQVISQMIRSRRKEVIWKDWDLAYDQVN